MDATWLPVAQPGYGHEVVNSHASYQSWTQQLEESTETVLGNATAANFNHLQGLAVSNPVLNTYHSPVSLRQSVSSDDSVTQITVSHLTRPYVGVGKQPEEAVWIKKEQADDAEQSGPGFASSSVILVPERPPRPGGDVDGEGSRDRKRRARFNEHLRKETRTPAGNIKQPEDGIVIKEEYADDLEQSRQGSMIGSFMPTAEEPMGPEGNAEGGEGSKDKDRKPRGRFDEGLRKETSNTRTMGACLRCHNQRVRCIPNKQDANSPIAPCETCLRVRRDSKKTIHFIPCLRFKVTSMVANRPGGLGYTRRFDHTKVVNITDFVDNTVFDIEMTQGLCRLPVRLRVRRFKPADTDISHRWYLENGIPKRQELGAFCLADVEKTAREFNEYISHNALDGLGEAVRGSDDIVKDTLSMIVRHCSSLPDVIKVEGGHTAKEARKKSLKDQKDFLQKIVRLWFAVRHGTGSAYLCGKEHLGMTPDKGFLQPYIPRMIVAQFDSIRSERIWKRLAPEVLRAFDTLLTSCNKEAWFTVFLATFLLLYQVACTSQDRYRHVRQNFEGKPQVGSSLGALDHHHPDGGGEGTDAPVVAAEAHTVVTQDTRYGPLNHPLTSFVEDVHHGAVMLLAHWQYFKRCDLMNFDWDNLEDSALGHLESYQVEFLRVITGRLTEKLDSIPKTPAEGCWEHELFWVSKMFVSDPSRKSDWSPPESFTRAKPSVGRE